MKKRLRSSISKSYKANNSTHIRLPIARQRQRPSTIDCVKTILFRQFILFKKMQKKKQLLVVKDVDLLVNTLVSLKPHRLMSSFCLVITPKRFRIEKDTQGLHFFNL